MKLYRRDFSCTLDTDGDGNCAMCVRNPQFHIRYIEVKGGTKLERKQRDELNRINKLVPGLKRVYDLENLIERFAADRDLIEHDGGEEALASFDADVLFLRRLAWDLHAMRKALDRNNRQMGRGWNPEEWKGTRP